MAAAPGLSAPIATLASILALSLGHPAAQSAEAHRELPWSFAPPAAVAPPEPQASATASSSHPIDRFIHRRLAAAGLQPAAEADRGTLLRRTTLALTGLPPTPAETEAFLADRRPEAFELLVDRLLASPHYGERMARWWLDLARYADTDGFHIDGHRDMWKWRDWVIEAFNANKPFDEFTVEQLAGDLLPGRTVDQWLASGFNRNNMTNIEGGADPEEYSVRYVIDRVNTTSTVWLGLTMKCAECHDHKYDPITQRDYYRFYALFNNVPERGLDGYFGNAPPIIPLPSPEQMRTLTGLQRQILAKEKLLEDLGPEFDQAQAQWERELAADGIETDLRDAPLLHYPLDSGEAGAIAEVTGTARPAVISGAGSAVWRDGQLEGAVALDGIGTHVDCGPVADFEHSDAFSVGGWINAQNGGSVVARFDDEGGGRGYDLAAVGNKVWFLLSHDWRKSALRVTTVPTISRGKWHHVLATYDGSGKAAGAHIYLDGVLAEVEIERDDLTGTTRCDEPLRLGRRSIDYGFQGALDDLRVYDRELSAAEVQRLAMQPALLALATPAADRTPRQREALRVWYRDHVSAAARQIADEIAPLIEERDAKVAQVPTSMVMDELPEPRPAHVLVRGDYRRPGEPVTAGVPAALPQPADAEHLDRLGLAKWLVDPAHPLTSRVAVNRLWEQMFGTGLVKTGDDFGNRGARPSHPELLDWLAGEFVRSGWDVKHMLRLMVTSATFRQDSAARPGLREVDPGNALLARAPRLRLDAETIRDNALAIAGLLDRRIGGPSVRPYQPPGLWEELSFGGTFTGQTYEQSSGADLYRRGVYVYWKRSSPYASFRIFDAPTRELCTVDRPVTNTPLQALVLLNDPVYVEAAAALATRLLTEFGDRTEGDRMRDAIRLCYCRTPRRGELEILRDLIAAARERFAAQPAAAAALLEAANCRVGSDLQPLEVAAWTMVASTLLNTSEVITRP